MLEKKICSLSELKSKNSIRLWIKDFKDEIIIFIDNNKIYVKSSVCPHFGGAIDYDKNKKHLYCAWHGLNFSFDGKCLNNKHFKKSLTPYVHKIVKNNIYIYKNESS